MNNFGSISRPLLLCCDWGSSNFRLYLVERSTQKILGQRSHPTGIKDVHARYSTHQPDERRKGFMDFLLKQVAVLGQDTGIDLTNVPVSVSGMAGSSIGYMQIPYSQVPFSLDRPSLSMHEIAPSSPNGRSTFFWGGLRTDSDIMRGEEVQLIGVASQFNQLEFTCILPGTHSKHIRVEGGEIMDFNTFMTGELFQLLRDHSMLQHSLSGTPDRPLTMEGFKLGVKNAMESSLLNALFQVRTRQVLNQVSSSENLAFLSGLLVGAELTSLPIHTRDIVIGTHASLLPLYQSAISIILPKARVQILDERAMEQALITGHCKLLEAYA